MTPEEIMSAVSELEPYWAKRLLDDLAATITEHGEVSLDTFARMVELRLWTQENAKGRDWL